jgi:hypothetical protein
MKNMKKRTNTSQKEEKEKDTTSHITQIKTVTAQTNDVTVASNPSNLNHSSILNKYSFILNKLVCWGHHT